MISLHDQYDDEAGPDSDTDDEFAARETSSNAEVKMYLTRSMTN